MRDPFQNRSTKVVLKLKNPRLIKLLNCHTDKEKGNLSIYPEQITQQVFPKIVHWEGRPGK